MSHQVTSRRLPQPTLPPIYEIFVGRQPIYTQQLDVFAYELLFRSGELQHAGVTDGNQATAQVLVNTFLELGLETLVGSPAPPLSARPSHCFGRFFLPGAPASARRTG